MKYAKVLKDGTIDWVVEIPRALNRSDHIKVVEQKIFDDPAMYRWNGSGFVKKPKEQIDAILAKRNKKDRLTLLEERISNLEKNVLIGRPV